MRNVSVKRRKHILPIVLLMIIVIVGSSYALFNKEAVLTNDVIVKSGNLEVVISNTTDRIIFYTMKSGQLIKNISVGGKHLYNLKLWINTEFGEYTNNNWNTGNITSFNYMFEYCSKLVGAVSYNGLKLDITMANPTTGYFTSKMS